MQRKVIIVSSIVLVSLFTISSGFSFFSKENMIRNHIIEYKKNNGGNSPSSIDMYENLERYSDSFRIPKHNIYNISLKVSLSILPLFKSLLAIFNAFFIYFSLNI